jgi:hypothetical protein
MQRTAMAFGDPLVASIDVRRRKNCTLVVDKSRTYWSVPNERLGTVGPWSRGAHVDIDGTPAHGLERPRPYDWATEVAA